MQTDTKLGWKLLLLFAAWLVPIAAITVKFAADVYTTNVTYGQRLTVSKLEWQRIQEVEKYTTLHQDTPAGDVPEDAFNVKRYTKSDDDSSEDRASFDINRWVRERDLASSGTPDAGPAWPTLDFVPDKDRFVGAQRPGKSYDRYVVFFRTLDSKIFRYDAPTNGTWRSFKAGETLIVDFDGYGRPRWGNLVRVD